MRRGPRFALMGLFAAVLAASTFQAAASPPEARFAVVTFEGRITDDMRSALAGTGPQILDYLPDDSYLVWATRPQAAAAARLDAVRAVATLAASRKVDPQVARIGGPSPVDVVVHAAALADVRSALGSVAAGPAMPVRSDGVLVRLEAILTGPGVARAAGLPGVLRIGPGVRGLELHDELTSQIQAGNLNADRTGAMPGYAAWLAQVGASGAGHRVAVVDSGIQDLHPDLAGKVVARHGYAEPGDLMGHGTLVGGIVAGDPSDLAPSDLEGFRFGLGVAPGATLVDQSFGFLGGIEAGRTLGRDAWRSGARIQNNSWGLRSRGLRVGYESFSRTYDEMARDADDGTPGREELLMVFSAGNDGMEGMSPPQEAKNIVTVGATESGRLLGGPSLVPGGDIDRVANFSSRGPAGDGRIYPTVVSPGARVVSARAPEGVYMPTNGACIAPPEGLTLYCSASGTSFSAPHVAGAAALIHEWWEKRHGVLPSPAMVKALLVNGADDIGPSNVPNRDEGWGRVNLRNVLQGGPALYEDQATVFGGPGEDATWEVEVTDPSRPLRVTVAWSDAPGAVGANPALVNDLDLLVELLDEDGVPVRSWLGNVFDGGVSVEGGEADRLNNLENVHLPAPQVGRYRITVVAENVPGDGIPHNADPTDQDFALVIRGGLAA